MTPSEASGTRAEHAGPGVALRAARTAQNLSVGEVARQLRLSVAQVEALEASAFERLPGPVFARGFVRNYARLLHLDPDVLLRSVAPALPAEGESQVPAIARGEPMPAARTVRWPRYAALLVLVLAALAAYELYLAGSPAPVEKAKPPAAVTVPAPTAPPSSEAPAPIRAESAAAGGAQTDAVTPEASVTPPSPALAAERAGSPSASGEGELQLSFEADSWVEVRDRNGKTIFSRLNRQGTDQRVKGAPPLVVVVGNPRAVRLTYNDRLVDLDPHTKRDVARLTLE
jgi:cytoskeleton protein RodZ